MITANLATYPPRRESLIKVARTLASQVDVMNIVLNQYDEIPHELMALGNVNAVIPDHDTKDAGKFLISPTSGLALLCDDDLNYPSDYVSKTIERFERIAVPKAIAGYHTSTYRLPRPWRGMPEIRRLLSFRKRSIPAYLKTDSFYMFRDTFRIVDQVGSGVCILRAADLPPYSYMRDSQKFVDVRLSRWSFERHIVPVMLPRDADWITPVRYDETIFRGFTQKHPAHVSDEIWTYAFRVKGRGKQPPLHDATA